MTDIVERLRGNYMPGDWGHLAVEAAAEIERLRAALTEAEKYNGYHQQACLEIERLRAALQAITNECKTKPANPFLADDMDRIARAALEPKP